MTEDKTAGARKLAQDAVGKHLTAEQYDHLFESVLAITKQAQGDIVCKKCKQRQIVRVEVPDARAVVTALTDLVTKIADIPKEQVQEQDRITFSYIEGWTPEEFIEALGDLIPDNDAARAVLDDLR
jgi:vacuolar-type H+-ATPase subunit I/STV1